MGIFRNIKEEFEKESYENIIKDLIEDEVEAIDGYESSKEKLLRSGVSSEVYNKTVKVFDHIITEEEEHIKELKELL